MNVIDLAVAVHRLLQQHDLPHAFGGALALNLYAEPRMTSDVDVSVFLPWTEHQHVVSCFDALGLRPTAPLTDATPIAGIRLEGSDGQRVDLFLALDEAYDGVLARAAMVDYGRNGERLPFFAAEDLVAFKLSFNRAKDWVDIQSVIRNGTPLDEATIERTLLALRGPTMYPRLARLRAIIAAGGEELR